MDPKVGPNFSRSICNRSSQVTHQASPQIDVKGLRKIIAYGNRSGSRCRSEGGDQLRCPGLLINYPLVFSLAGFG